MISFAGPPRVQIYLAGRYTRRVELLSVASRLRDLGADVTSRWLDGRNEPDSDQAARVCLADIDRADGILSFTENPQAGYMSGGRHVEFGYALGRGKWLWLIGPRENVFHHVGRVKRFLSVEDWAAYMTGSKIAGPTSNDPPPPTVQIESRVFPDGPSMFSALKALSKPAPKARNGKRSRP